MTAESDIKIHENSDAIEVPLPTDPEVNVIDPLAFFEKEESQASRVLLVLNQEIRLPSDFFAKVWSNADIHVCADGGAERLLTYCQKNSVDYVPQYIVGDLDSLTEATKEHYEKKGTIVKPQHSQYFSDLDKSIALIDTLVNIPSLDLTKLDDYSELELTEAKMISECGSSAKEIVVMVVGAIGGRFDQTIATISRTLQSQHKRPWMDFLLLNAEHFEYIIIVPKGDNFIHYPKKIKTGLHDLRDPDRGDKLRNIGLIPLSGPVNITTRGLKWDVTDWHTEINGDLSLCNLQVGDTGFYIKASSDIFANVEF